MTIFLNKRSILIMLLSFSAFGQNDGPIEQILPMKDIDQTYEKIQTALANMGSMVHVDMAASMKNYDDCKRNDRTPGGLNIEIDWYNTNDEVGKMMANLIKSDIENIMNSFHSSSGFENLDKAKEVEIKGGKMWINSKQKACVNEITGPTGETEFTTQIRAFVSTETMVLKIDLKANSKPATLEHSLNYILEKVSLVNFSSLTSK
ncbi:PH domain-containing protein [Flavobacterium lacus]|uniref:Uncharacterized protein n=1 Tax=Flavobacterium lacus TaxID=1353778 RepID=A0A328WJ10_9FLAO|nr:hypothetical protein [Flavobacterium lacus]RAR46362.1 hypothetical protein B0I10_1219 [Flavobacterium lacus]